MVSCRFQLYLSPSPLSAMFYSKIHSLTCLQCFRYEFSGSNFLVYRTSWWGFRVPFSFILWLCPSLLVDPLIFIFSHAPNQSRLLFVPWLASSTQFGAYSSKFCWYHPSGDFGSQAVLFSSAYLSLHLGGYGSWWHLFVGVSPRGGLQSTTPPSVIVDAMWMPL